MSGDSTRKSRTRKANERPKKPYPEFPLSPHPSGAWQKRIRGKLHYFGRWAKRVNGKLERVEGDGWKQALEDYKKVADDLHAGRTPRERGDGLTVVGLCNAFLNAKQRQREAGEISARMFQPTADPKKPKGEYPATTDRLVAAFGSTRLVADLAPNDFEALRAALAEQYGPVRLANEIQKVRTVFKYGYEADLIDKPVRFGPTFKKPSASVLRRHRAKQGAKLFTAEEIRLLLAIADPQMKAMILLGANCGFGMADCGRLPAAAVDLKDSWIDFPRPKTGIARRCPLWPETVSALDRAMAVRPAPKDATHARLVFLTAQGYPWHKESMSGPLPFKFRQLVRKAGITGRSGLGFYTLRHVFRTIADAARDPVAVDLMMGHADPSMGGHYRERIDDERLHAVAEHVRAWLFVDTPKTGSAGKIAAATEQSERPGRRQPDKNNDAGPSLRLYTG
jgi:integrase